MPDDWRCNENSSCCSIGQDWLVIRMTRHQLASGEVFSVGSVILGGRMMRQYYWCSDCAHYYRRHSLNCDWRKVEVHWARSPWWKHLSRVALPEALLSGWYLVQPGNRCRSSRRRPDLMISAATSVFCWRSHWNLPFGLAFSSRNQFEIPDSSP